MARFVRRLSPATVMSAAALFIALGGTTYAATGGNFLLGKTNSAGATSALNSGVTTGPTLALKNTGGKPAASFTTSGSQPPFLITSGTRVVNLNADLVDGLDGTDFLRANGKAVDSDKLDGIDSSGFIQGTGMNGWGGVKSIAPGAQPIFGGTSGPRGYTLGYQCPPSSGGTTNGVWQIDNPSSSTETFQILMEGQGSPAFVEDEAPNSELLVANKPATHITTIQLFWPGHKLVTVTGGSTQTFSGCDVQVEVRTAGS